MIYSRSERASMERAMAAMLGHVYGPSGELVELKRQEKGLKLLIFA
ncbi:hypothetical protein NTGBS_690049 [Candidatus Nitrotoga sp. BS]|nr:hypothetical protein NTGBS_690049 [Candidatus Nitrotoga sp. BS]